eukprot:CAMPEP_0171775604 /NCGR_PEP_ID=MMETSP0991-20121206/56613_1 /TAXON_ID=483369 /ORGANISM="non described non described, Strain CCMP2098" /LENGTH=114 /DNA_ID=CAMNT_0012381815 /DNA_START=538 /DNA_END=879 /DNA_ORIENTATION=-
MARVNNREEPPTSIVAAVSLMTTLVRSDGGCVEVGGWEDEPKEGSLDGSWLFPLRTGSFWRSKASNENEPVIDPEPGTLYESWSLPGATPNATLGERGIELMDVGDMETDQMDW